LTWRELRQALHEELGRLPEKYRFGLILCHLEGMTQDEAARQLGWTQGMLRGRLLRGRELLGARLLRRGLAPSGPLLAPGLSQGEATAALPGRLADAAVKAAQVALVGKVGSGTIPAQVIALAEGELRAMVVTQLKAGAAILLALGLAAGAGWLACQAASGKP